MTCPNSTMSSTSSGGELRNNRRYQRQLTASYTLSVADVQEWHGGVGRYEEFHFPDWASGLARAPD